MKEADNEGPSKEAAESTEDKKNDNSTATTVKEATTEKDEAKFVAKSLNNRYTITVIGDKNSGLTHAEEMHVTKVKKTEIAYINALKNLSTMIDKEKDGEIRSLYLYTIEFFDGKGASVNIKGDTKITFDYTEGFNVKKDDTILPFAGHTVGSMVRIDAEIDRSETLVRQISYTLNKEGMTGIAVVGKIKRTRN